jgi:hypothetical protein
LRASREEAQCVVRLGALGRWFQAWIQEPEQTGFKF